MKKRKTQTKKQKNKQTKNNRHSGDPFQEALVQLEKYGEGCPPETMKSFMTECSMHHEGAGKEHDEHVETIQIHLTEKAGKKPGDIEIWRKSSKGKQKKTLVKQKSATKKNPLEILYL